MEDAITTLANLIHMEIHSINSYHSTKDKEWLELANEARKDRSDLLEEVTKKDRSQIWCFNKHTLASVVGLMELGNRKYSQGKEKEAIGYYDKAGKWIAIFLEKNGF